MDHLTRYAEAFPLPNQSAETIARIFVNEIIARYGTVQTLLTDRGTNFLSALFKSVCSMLGVKKLQTTAYHPSCNKVNERINATLMKYLSHYVNLSRVNWDDYLSLALLAYRNAVHSSTKDTPVHMLFGRDLRMPFDDIIQTRPFNYSDTKEYKDEILKRLKIAIELAKQHLAHSAETNKKQRAKKANAQTFKIGDRSSFIYTCHRSRKN